MKIEIKDKSLLPEWLQKFVDGDTLDLGTLPEAEDVSGLKSALAKERENVSKYAKIGTPDEIRAQIDALKEEAKSAGSKGKETDEQWQAKLDALEEKHKAAIADKDAKISKLQSRTTTANLKSELASAGFIPEAIEDIAASALSRIEYAEDGTPRVLTKDGKPMIGSGPDHGATLADLAKELAEAKPYAVADAGKGGGGKPTDGPGGTPKKKFSELTSGELVKLKRENPQEYDRLKAAG